MSPAAKHHMDGGRGHLSQGRGDGPKTGTSGPSEAARAPSPRLRSPILMSNVYVILTVLCMNSCAVEHSNFAR